ncbi:ribosome biogenesis protein BOP1 homolog [Nymphaea colorata]|nr:ribosome biogenesis protein BOP1 homolog [Nymphaea colorata]
MVALESIDVRENGGIDEEETHIRVEESDSSEDEVPSRNTIGDVPLKWYEEEEHIGYDISGKKIKKQPRKDKLDAFLADTDDSKNWRRIYDEYNDEEVELTKEETKIIQSLLRGKTPHGDANPYEPSVDWFDWEGKGHPLSNAPEPKRRFIPSKSEHKKVVSLARAIRKGLIKFSNLTEENDQSYLMWGDDSSPNDNAEKGSIYFPPPKPKVPGHETSFRPSVEFIPTQEEINSYELMFEEDRPKFIPRGYEFLREVPAYMNLKDCFERCLDLYLCPRTRKKKLNIDPEDLKPKLPNKKNLQPYPTTCFLEYKGHTGPVTSISIESSGQLIASGSIDGTVRIWEIETSRCLRDWRFDEPILHVAWNPISELPILAVAVGQDVVLLNASLGNAEDEEKVKDLLHVSAPVETDESSNKVSPVTWAQHGTHDGIKLKHFKAVSSVEWHRKGDYFTTVVPDGDSRSILIHQLSKKLTHNPFKKLHGIAVSAVFHPSRSTFFIATRKNVRVYDLVKHTLIKKLETRLREVSSIAIHPAGDNVIVGSKDGKLCWFDMDLSSRPYRTLTLGNKSKDINHVAFHRSYPLFASCSDDCLASVFHGMVYSDLNENPCIMALETLTGHQSANGRGVLDCKFHPRQPWLFTAGADSIIKLFCH